MKLTKLKIDGYKNLKEVEFDFSGCSNYAVLVGLNGSGKSNVLEAISIIFASYFNNKILEWNFELTYTHNSKKVSLKNGQLFVENGKISKEKNNYLPSEIIACYSGEELRLWKDVYFNFYDKYCQKIKNNNINAINKMTYLNKYSWEIALIVMLCSDDKNLSNKILKLIKIDSINDVNIAIYFNQSFYKNYQINNATRFADELNPNHDQEVEIDLLTIKLCNTLKESGDGKKRLINLFRYLYILSMPKDFKLIETINVQFNNINTTLLSEGEKKIILITFIQEILSTPDSIVLLDEPNSHLHTEREKEIEDIINKDNHFTILTTHSPTLLNHCSENNIFIISNKNSSAVKVFKGDKQKHISEITNGEVSLIDSTLALSSNQDILLVEGKNDYNYLNEALKRFKDKYKKFNYLIINCGGAGNVASILEELILPVINEKQLCVCSFDDDKAGDDGIKAVRKILDSDSKQYDNVKYLKHPKYEGFSNGDFFMEDYFDVESYRKILEKNVSEKNKFIDFNQGLKVKSIIESNYTTFDNSAYNKFETILDELLRIQRDFYNTTPYPKNIKTEVLYTINSPRLRIAATGFYNESSNEFTVKKGSFARKSFSTSTSKSLTEFQKELISEGILELSNNNLHYVFTKDYLFKSDSVASSIILGSKKVWKKKPIGFF